jgi:hypothetical protein
MMQPAAGVFGVVQGVPDAAREPGRCCAPPTAPSVGRSTMSTRTVPGLDPVVDRVAVYAGQAGDRRQRRRQPRLTGVARHRHRRPAQRVVGGDAGGTARSRALPPGVAPTVSSSRKCSTAPPPSCRAVARPRRAQPPAPLRHWTSRPAGKAQALDPAPPACHPHRARPGHLAVALHDPQVVPADGRARRHLDRGGEVERGQ